MYYNEYIQVFDLKGNYKYIISLAGERGNNFSIERNKKMDATSKLTLLHPLFIGFIKPKFVFLYKFS